jgi:hypothetical protein
LGRKGLREWFEWLSADERLRVLDAIEDQGYRLDVDELNERVTIYEASPGRKPPQFVKRLYRWRCRKRFAKQLQVYVDVNGPPTVVTEVE